MSDRHKNYAQNVFINCPFDDEYSNLLKVLIFTICYFGYIPRISLEDSDSGQLRLDKILTIIKECKYSIHDLSRLQAKATDEYYRLNMPFELGIDFGLRVFNDLYNDKKSLILERSPFDYLKAISDISGMDIKHHNNNLVDLIACVRTWFSETVKLMGLNGSEKIYADYIGFNTMLFDAKVVKYRNAHSPKPTITEAERYAECEIREMGINEYITEINKWCVKFIK